MSRKLLILSGLALMLPVLFMIGNAIRPEQPEASVSEGATSGQRLSELLGSKRSEGYAIARMPRTFTFPMDHGPHPEFRNEWWYLTGNLEDDRGQRFGYEFTIFRFSLSAEPPEQSVSPSWKTNQVYIAHFAVTDKENRKFHVLQRAARGALGLAGAQSMPFRVWIEDWSIAGDKNAISGESPEHWQLDVEGGEMGLQLDLLAEKPIVLNGEDGLSQKSDAIGNASYYYSISRLRSTGTLQVGDEQFRVTGTSWLDREWSSSALADDQLGWDWFALQLSDGSDLMFYNLRKSDGSQDRHSAGTWVDEGGQARHLDRDEVIIRETGIWESPRGGIYPGRWELRVPSLNLNLTITPVIPDQELVTTVRYWEGAVDVAGSRGGRGISGRGYIELTGYAQLP